MKVEKVVGWLTGLAGTGNVYEVSEAGKFLLAMIWQDNKFHALPKSEFDAHATKSQAGFINDGVVRPSYLDPAQVTSNPDGSLPVENPNGWQRLYEATEPVPTPETGEADQDSVSIPISVTFSGSLKISAGGLSKILNILD